MPEFIAFVAIGKINFLIFTCFSLRFNHLSDDFISEYVGYFKNFMSDNLKILKYVIMYIHKDLKILLQNFLLFLIIVF